MRSDRGRSLGRGYLSSGHTESTHPSACKYNLGQQIIGWISRKKAGPGIQAARGSITPSPLSNDQGKPNYDQGGAAIGINCNDVVASVWLEGLACKLRRQAPCRAFRGPCRAFPSAPLPPSANDSPLGKGVRQAALCLGKIHGRKRAFIRLCSLLNAAGGKFLEHPIPDRSNILVQKKNMFF
jgi:hypothetical protein